VTFQEWVELAGQLIDGAGVLTVLLGVAWSTGVIAWRLLRRQGPLYRPYRQSLGRSILLGLELLVAADILRTISTEPTLQQVVVLGLVVLIRTFLSFSLEIELEGRWPWQGGRRDGALPAQQREAP
jgi:uncharacterized membrane protein